MKLSPREVEKLGLHNAGYLAQKRLARGLRLNYTEAVSFIVTQVLAFVYISSFFFGDQGFKYWLWVCFLRG